ncbi:MAG: hypothetical protein QME74_03155 [Candidatus Edwardsbacteria bacterium]|nr:hypothetical protein [Candidatus Edwardsbacteria bacterium]
MTPENGDIHIVKPVQCHLMDLAGLAARDIVGAMDTVAVYEDESHLIRKLYHCRKCGQLYFYEFYEEIDWAEGNDPQYRTMIPVADERSGDLLNLMPPVSFGAYPAIRMDYPKEATAPQPPCWTKEWN